MIIPPLSSLKSLGDIFLFKQQLRQETVDKKVEERQEKGSGCCGKKRKSFGKEDNT